MAPRSGPSAGAPSSSSGGLRRLVAAAAAAAGAGVGVLAAGVATQRVVDLRVGRLPMPGTMVPVDGGRVHVAERGAPDGAVVVAETGLGGTAADWERVGDALPPGVRLLAVDRPGLGRSDLGPVPDVAGTVRRLEAVLTHAGVAPPVVLVGWSLGGLLDVGVALRRPDLVSGLVLVDPSHPEEARRFRDPALHPIGRLGLRGLGVGARLGGAALAGVPARVLYLRTSTADGREPLWQLPSYATAASGRALAAELLAFPHVCDEVGALRPDGSGPARPPLPVVLLSATRRAGAEEAETWDELHRDLAGWFDGTEVRPVERSAHDVPADRPDAVAEAIGQVVRAAAVLSSP